MKPKENHTWVIMEPVIDRWGAKYLALWAGAFDKFQEELALEQLDDIREAVQDSMVGRVKEEDLVVF